MTRKQKAKLSFEMLEKELGTLMPQDLLYYKGGTDGISGSGYFLPNGYCVFNSLSYLFTGDTGNAQSYVDHYVSMYGNTAVYDNGTLMGYQFTSSTITNLMAQEGGAGWGSNLISGSDISGTLAGGGRVMILLPNAGPNGEMHAVVVNSVNSDGTLDIYDPTMGTRTPSFSGSTGMIFGATSQAW